MVPKNITCTFRGVVSNIPFFFLSVLYHALLFARVFNLQASKLTLTNLHFTNRSQQTASAKLYQMNFPVTWISD